MRNRGALSAGDGNRLRMRLRLPLLNATMPLSISLCLSFGPLTAAISRTWRVSFGERHDEWDRNTSDDD